MDSGMSSKPNMSLYKFGSHKGFLAVVAILGRGD